MPNPIFPELDFLISLNLLKKPLEEGVGFHRLRTFLMTGLPLEFWIPLKILNALLCFDYRFAEKPIVTKNAAWDCFFSKNIEIDLFNEKGFPKFSESLKGLVNKIFWAPRFPHFVNSSFLDWRRPCLEGTNSLELWAIVKKNGTTLKGQGHVM